jgi:hypothetical protein
MEMTVGVRKTGVIAMIALFEKHLATIIKACSFAIRASQHANVISHSSYKVITETIQIDLSRFLGGGGDNRLS